MPIWTPGRPDTIETTDPQTKHIDIYGVQMFVRRDLRSLMRNYFADVVVDETPGLFQPTPGYVAEVRIVRLDTTADTHTTISNNLTGTNLTVANDHRAYGVLDWSIVIRDSATNEVVYSFADRAVGTFALTNVRQSSFVIASALETALIRFGEDLRTRNVVATLGARNAPAPAPVPAVAPVTEVAAPSTAP